MTEIRCARCDDTDGPFAETTDGWVCEGCINGGEGQ